MVECKSTPKVKYKSTPMVKYKSTAKSNTRACCVNALLAYLLTKYIKYKSKAMEECKSTPMHYDASPIENGKLRNLLK